MERQIRILLVDDHEVIRHGIRALLEPRRWCKICGEACNGQEALALAKKLEPELVIMDLSLPDIHGIEVTRQISKLMPDVRIVVFSMHLSKQHVRQLLSAGAHGYVHKSDAARDLVTAIERVFSGGRFFPDADDYDAKGNLSQDGQSKPAKSTERAGILSPRERQIVALLAEGKSNKETAAALGISVKTAETHRARVMRKLQITSLAQLVHYAVRHQLIHL